MGVVDNERNKITIREAKKRFLAGLLNTHEGQILLAGFTITFISIIFIVFSLFWKPDLSEILVAMISTDIAFGWIASMSLGYTIGLSHIQIVLINMVIETTLVLLFYPLFVFSWKRVIVIRVLKNLMDRIGRVAENSRKTIQKYGIFGLFLFAWAPFWMTGPVVGSAIGFLIGLRPLHNLSIVLSATYLAIFCWAIILGRIHNSIAAFGPFAPITFLLTIILIVLAGNFFLNRNRAENSEEKQIS